MIGGWVGKILRIDLSSQKISYEDTMKYAKDFIGGRGIAAKIAWEEIKSPIDPFSPENLLIFMTGPLTGTLAPASGRTIVCGIAPQVYPTPWFTRSNMGGQWGSELKYAGFDGIIIKGKSEKPVYLYIHDNEIEINDAKDLWGLDTYSTQKMILNKHGKDVKVACIGPAGENLVRISVILTETESAAGQGGFGAVMGSKNLKAIAVKGSGYVKIADPEAFLELCLAIKKELTTTQHIPIKPSLDPEQSIHGQRLQNCSHSCYVHCCLNHFYKSVPGIVSPGINTGQFHCISPLFPGIPNTYYDWNPGFRGGFEASVLSNKYGINQWELIIGTFAWLRKLKQEGILTNIDGIEIDLNDPKFWYETLKKIAYREGKIGNALAEGGPRAAEILNIGKEYIPLFWAAYGYTGHWDGRGDKINPIFYPVWIVSALQWATDTRDPFSSSHDYVAGVSMWSKVIKWEDIYKISERIYGSRKATDLETPYEYKAQPAIWHQHRSVLKDSLILCDWAFPRIFSLATEDHYARIETSKGIIEGPLIEYYFFKTVTGLDMSKEELDKITERIFNLERAIQIRNHNRSRKDDEAIIPYFEYEEFFIGPLGKREKLNREKFKKLLNEYYELRGWDIETGRPKSEKLIQLGLKDVALELKKLDLIN
ncbi:MAG: aldehyde ferredoxin oxidoreductase N-terminal domain-containing protein [Nitrososphaerota archaeon]